MSLHSIQGREHIPSEPSFFIANRVDLTALRLIDKSLGGVKKVAWMVEDVLRPELGLMEFAMRGNRRHVFFHFRQSRSNDVREKVYSLMEEGYHVVFLPGKPETNIGSISDVPMPFMMQLAALHIAPVPIFVGYYRHHLERSFCTDADWDELRVCFLPKLAPGPMTGDRLLQAWMECSAELYGQNPILITSMRRHGKVEFIDGLDDTRLSYYKVLGVALALSRVLRQMVKEPRVGILLPPGKGGTIANLACIFAGITPVNINYTSSESAFASIVEQGGIKRFITARAFMVKLPQFPWPKDETIIHLDKTLKAISKAKLMGWIALTRFAPMALIAKKAQLSQRAGDDEAILLFTSGSSGAPKGVSISHHMMLTNVSQIMSRYSLPTGGALLCSLPIFHSFGLMATTLLPLLYGFSMVSYPSPLEAKKLNELIETHKCRLVISTPTFARSMLRRSHENTFASVKYFVLGGEKLPPELTQEFKEKRNLELLEGYGLTETTPACGVSVPEVRGSEQQPYYVPGYRVGTIGAIVPGMAVRITDPDDESKPLNLSEQGMVWLKGPNVFKGYVGRSELNKEIFSHDGWFKTGDLGSVDLNGMMSLGGRRSRFSKIAAEMIPHEVVEQAIDTYLDETYGVAEERRIAIVSVPDSQKGEAMVLLSSHLRAQLAQGLDAIRKAMVAQGFPRLWVPREIIPVEAIPMLASGKLDLKGCQILAYESLGLQI